MSNLDDRHGGADRADQLTLRALGEPVPELDAHLRGCERCQAELGQLRSVATVGRDPVTVVHHEAPPERLWQAIRAELVPAEQVAPVRRPAPAPHRRRRWLAVAAAAAILFGAAGAGVAIGRSTSHTVAADSVRSRAQLDRLGAPAGSSGTAELVRHGGRLVLRVHAHGLPVRVGYYEVWLYDPTSKRMVAVGTLGTGEVGEFTVPEHIDLGVFHVVDISAQDFDGDPAHKQSMLRGSLTA